MRLRIRRLLLGAVLATAGVLFVPSAALAIDEFPLSPNSGPAEIIVGPDGRLWFTEAAGNRIGAITTSGAVTEYALPPGMREPNGIAVGPDGRLWFTLSAVGDNKIGAITTSGAVSEYPGLPGGLEPNAIIAVGASLFFTDSSANKIGKIDPTTGAITAEYNTGSRPSDLTLGPDGRIWFTEENANGIGRIDPAAPGGAFSDFPIPTPGSGADGIFTGLGALWFTENLANKIGRITTEGSITAEFPVGAGPSGITAGRDDALWFTESEANAIGRITTLGNVSEFPIPTPASEPDGIVSGPDGRLWFTEFLGSKIGRIDTAPPAPPLPPPPPTPPLTPVSVPQSTPRRTCRVPKLKRLTVRRARKKLRRAKCRYKIRGKGRVYSVRPRAGRRTSKTVRVRAKRKRSRSKRSRSRRSTAAAIG